MIKDARTILIQGAMESELSFYKEQKCFFDCENININGFDFFITNREETKLILSLTKMGMTNAAIATMTAIDVFHPDIIINQGTAGAHVRELSSGDFVIGTQAVHIHSMEMPKRDEGEGMSPEQWKGMSTKYLDSNPELVTFFEQEFANNQEGNKVVSGILGSGDLFSKEKDRIKWLHSQFGNLSEDMESFAVYAACSACHVPCAAVRVISNNELLNEDYDPQTAIGLQKAIWNALISVK